MDPRRIALALTTFAALGLAGCKDQGNRAAVAAAPTVQGPVNPDAGVTTYLCIDGETITAGYPDRQTAVVTYKDHAYTLKLVSSGSGARYTGYGLQWWTKGAHAAIAALKPGTDVAGDEGLACSVAPEAGGQTTTRTAYEPAAKAARLSSTPDRL